MKMGPGPRTVLLDRDRLGRRPWYCDTFGHIRQHYGAGFLAEETLCGWPTLRSSSAEVRTLLGLTCGTCKRNFKASCYRPTWRTYCLMWLLTIVAWPIVKVHDRRARSASSSAVVSGTTVKEQQ